MIFTKMIPTKKESLKAWMTRYNCVSAIFDESGNAIFILNTASWDKRTAAAIALTTQKLLPVGTTVSLAIADNGPIFSFRVKAA